MAVEVSIEMFGDLLFRREIRAMRYRAMDMSPVMESIGGDLQSHIEHVFQTEGAWSGEKWAQLTIEYAAARGSAHPILIRDGDMLLEMTNPESISVSDDSVTVEIPEHIKMKAESAQYGFTSRAGKKIAPRKMVNLSVLDDFAFREKITDYLVNGNIGRFESYFTP
jgi:hypothetical protein